MKNNLKRKLKRYRKKLESQRKLGIILLIHGNILSLMKSMNLKDYKKRERKVLKKQRLEKKLNNKQQRLIKLLHNKELL